MIDIPNMDEEAIILPPDRTLLKKLGNASLDQLLSPQAVEAAQQIIAGSSDNLREESAAEVRKIERATQNLGGAADKIRQALREIMAAAFTLRSNAGLGGYELVSLLAKSLHQCCEQIGDSDITPVQKRLIEWHVTSLTRLLTLRVKGSGGTVGEAILAELNKLGVRPDQQPPAIEEDKT